MERFFSHSAASPLHTLSVLEDNLKRERRVFSIAIGLLIFSVICVAWVVVFAFMEGVSRREQENAQVLMHNVNTAIALRQNMLTVAQLLTTQADAQSDNTIAAACLRSGAGEDLPVLRRSCNESLARLSKADQATPLEIARWDGSVSYGAGFWSATADVKQRPVNLIRAAKSVLSAHNIDPVAAARAGRVFWFPAPRELGFSSSVTLAFTVVARDDRPYALVFTHISIKQVFAESATTGLIADTAVFDAQNNLIEGALTEPILFAQSHVPIDKEGHFHWQLWHGWGSRMLLPQDLGTVVFALPGSRTLPSLRTELIAVTMVVLALITALLTMYRYWNYRYLTRTYDEARRGLEGEILNHLLVHATPIGLCIVLRNDFRIIAANQKARDVLGLDDEAVRLPLGLCEAFEQRGVMPGTGTDDGGIEQFQYSLARPSGSPLHLEISYAPAYVNKTEVLFCAIADITEQHAAENLLRQAKETSEQSARARLSFFASMSHEIRTPLASLLGSLELVALGPLSPEQDARVHAMQASAFGLLQVVNDVLDFSSMDIGEMRLTPAWHSLRELIVLVAAAHTPLANQLGLRLFVVIDRHCPDRLMLDAVRVSQILNNLLGNAFKFTPAGKVVLRAAWVDHALQLTVADSGVGIPDALQSRLFQPFTQGEGQRLAQVRGTGLGLSICAHLCELMHGRVALESIEGIGTRVQVNLPLEADATQPALTVLSGKPAILCHAPEYREWFENLYDPAHATPVWITPQTAATDLTACHYLVVTDEFTPQDIASLWPDASRLVYATQGGPLLPTEQEDGALQVGIFSLKGFMQAVAMLESRPEQPLIAIAPSPVASKSQDDALVVLIAEDNTLNRGLLRDQLRTIGARVIEAADGEEALALLHLRHVDLVLTDMDMPRMTGTELLAAIRKDDARLPVYAVSASASTQEIEHGRTLGFTDYLTKPVALAVLASILQAPAQGVPFAPGVRADLDDLPPRFPPVPPAYVGDLLEQIDTDLATLDQLCARQDINGLRRWAHKISGGLVVLGPSMLLDQSEELRELLHANAPWEDIEVFTTILNHELSALRDLTLSGHSVP